MLRRQSIRRVNHEGIYDEDMPSLVKGTHSTADQGLGEVHCKIWRLRDILDRQEGEMLYKVCDEQLESKPVIGQGRYSPCSLSLQICC